MSPSKCGYVAIIGRPNVGKSTLLNDILGKKVSITTAKPQTTRTQLLGIRTTGSVQTIYIDTPGIHDAEKRAMNRYMNRLAGSVIVDADVIVFIVEALRWTDEDNLVLTKLKETQAPVVLVINKIDKVKDKGLLLPFLEKIKSKYTFADIIPLSAKNHDNVDALEKCLDRFIPEGPHLFPDDQITDKNERFQAAEIIREKLIKMTEQEIPYTTTVEIESFTITEKKLIEINAVIWVEREGQKPIVIGKKGALLKKIGSQSRKEMETLFGQKVFLRLWVKVKSGWTDDERALRSLGYN